MSLATCPAFYHQVSAVGFCHVIGTCSWPPQPRMCNHWLQSPPLPVLVPSLSIRRCWVEYQPCRFCRSSRVLSKGHKVVDTMGPSNVTKKYHGHPRPSDTTLPLTWCHAQLDLGDQACPTSRWKVPLTKVKVRRRWLLFQKHRQPHKTMEITKNQGYVSLSKEYSKLAVKNPKIWKSKNCWHIIQNNCADVQTIQENTKINEIRKTIQGQVCSLFSLNFSNLGAKYSDWTKEFSRELQDRFEKARERIRKLKD